VDFLRLHLALVLSAFIHLSHFLGPSPCPDLGPALIFTVLCVSPVPHPPSGSIFSLSCVLEGPKAEWRSR
jgi:hypothetical protein